MSVVVVFCKQKTAYEMRISDGSSDVCSSDLGATSPADAVCKGGPSTGPRQASAASSPFAPPPATAGGDWEGVATVRADPKAPLPSPPLPSQGTEQKLAASATPAGMPIRNPTGPRSPPPRPITCSTTATTA